MENLTIQSVANAVILPYRRCSHSTGLGGVIDETGVYVERSYLHGGCLNMEVLMILINQPLSKVTIELSISDITSLIGDISL